MFFANNSRLHDKDQIKQIADSIKEFGFNNPVLLDGVNGIIAGHGRVMAAQFLGLAEVPTIELSHLTDEQKSAYVIADNKIAINAKWDNEILALELKKLEESGFNVSLTGFGQDEITDLLDLMDDSKSKEMLEYTKKIDTPIYEPKGKKPDLSMLVDRRKSDELIEKINNSKVTDEEKEFLRLAAQRHLVFDYQEIAEYYAHAGKAMQELMENSALVIIDFQKAIEQGYVVMSQKIDDIYADSYMDIDSDEE